MLALMLCAALLQAADGAEIRALVERLRSDVPEEREQAARKLKALGKACLPELERAAAHSDPEVSRRAERLRRVIVIAEGLTPAVRKTFPGIEERLAGADLHAWTEEFLGICAEARRGRKYESLKPEDFRGLLGPAVRGAESQVEKSLICSWAGILRLTAAAPELAPLLKDPSPTVRRDALRTISIIGARRLSAEILPLLKDEKHLVKREAVEACGALGLTAAVSTMVPLMEDEEEEIRWTVVQALARLEAREAIPALQARLKDSSSFVRRAAASALGELDARDAQPSLLLALADPKPEVRAAAAGALCRLGSFEGVRPLLAAAAADSTVEFWMLNDLRSPAVVKRLRAVKVRWPFPDRKEATAAEVVRALTGLEVDAAKAPAGWNEIRVPESFVDRWSTAAEIVRKPDFVIEADRLICMPRDEALKFWNAWADAHEPPKK